MAKQLQFVMNARVILEGDNRRRSMANQPQSQRLADIGHGCLLWQTAVIKLPTNSCTSALRVPQLQVERNEGTVCDLGNCQDLF